MTGYLRSLADRAAPPGPRVRPVSTPYAPSAFAFDQDTEPASPNQPPPPATSMDVTQPDQARQTTERIERPARRASARTTEPSDLAPRGSLVIAPQPSNELPAMTRAAAPAPAFDPPRHQSTSGRPPEAANQHRAATPTLTPLPSTLLPSRELSSRPVTELRQSREPAATPRDDGPPDVHIHIGRIELTALTALEPPRRPPPGVKTAMPLEEYLQRRNRRER